MALTKEHRRRLERDLEVITHVPSEDLRFAAVRSLFAGSLDYGLLPEEGTYRAVLAGLLRSKGYWPGMKGRAG